MSLRGTGSSPSPNLWAWLPFCSRCLPSSTPLRQRNATASHEQDISRDVFTNHHGCTDDGTRADFYPRHDRATGAEPGTVTDLDWCRTGGTAAALRIRRIVRSSEEHHVLSNSDVIADVDGVLEF